MTSRPVSPIRHPDLLWKRLASLVGVVLFGGLTACCAWQLGTFKTHAQKNDYRWIAAQTVACEKRSNICGQLHLIKGDACLHLAVAEMPPAENFACAADELERGLALTPSWNDVRDHRRFQEYLCEALGNLQDLQSGQAAEQTLVRFEKAAEALYRLAPKSVPAVYYLAKVHLHQVAPMLLDINPATRVPACNRLKRAVTNVLSMMETAKKQALPDWDRFADNYRKLAFDLGLAMRTAQCR